MPNRPLSPLELDPSLRDTWIDADVIHPARSLDLNGYVASEVHSSIDPFLDGYRVTQESQEIHAFATLPAPEAANTSTAWSSPSLDPTTLASSDVSEGILRALVERDDQPHPLYGPRSPEPWAPSTSIGTGTGHLMYAPDRDRQMSWDYSDADAPPPYTPTQPHPSLSPATPSLSSGSLSGLDTPLSTFSPLSTPSSPQAHGRYRSPSSAGVLIESSPTSDGSGRFVYRKRSASSTGPTKQAVNVGQRQIRSVRELPSPPSRFALSSPTEQDETEWFVQGSFSSSQPEAPLVLSGRIRKAIARLSEYVHAMTPAGRLDYGGFNERVMAIVEPVKMLLYVTAMPVEDAWYDTVPGHVRRSCVPRYAPERLRKSYFEVIGPLSDLVATSIALRHDVALSETHLKTALPNLDSAIQGFIKEVQYAQQGQWSTSRGSSTPVKSYRGNFLTPEGIATPGAGSAGSWKGFGFSQRSEVCLRQLEVSVISELTALVGPIETKLRGLVASSSSAARKSDRLQFEGQIITSLLDSFLHYLGNLDLKPHGFSTTQSGADAVERARLIRTLEAAIQALYDDSAVFFVTMSGSLASLASSSSRRDPLGVLVTAIMANISLTLSTLKTLLTIAPEKKSPASVFESPQAIASRRNTSTFTGDGTLPTDPDSSIARTDDGRPGEFIDMELALTRPTININTSVTRLRHKSPNPSGYTLHVPKLSASSSLGTSSDERSTASSPFRPPTPSQHRHRRTLSDVSASSDASWTAISAEQSPISQVDGSNNKSPQRATKLFQILGRDAPRHYIDNMNNDSKAWYLRPTYVHSEIRIEPNGEVTAGTRIALVERLTAHDHGDAVFQKDFLMTFKSFMTVDELFEMLVERYWIQAPQGLNADELNEWTSLKQHVIRTRVLNTLKNMVYDEDVLENNDMHILDTMKEFVTTPEVLESRAAKQVLAAVVARTRGSGTKAKGQLLTMVTPPTPIIPRSRQLKLLDIDPLELARQLTLLESAWYKKIRPSECLRRVREPDSDKSKDSIAAVIRLNTKIVNWVVESILSRSDARKRGQTIKHFVSVADRCRNLQNLSSMFAIVSALNKPEIRRLTRSWNQVPSRNLILFSTCEALLEPSKNYHNYWSALEAMQPPCIPFFGRYLSTLTFINDGAKDNISKGQMINFRKRQKAAGVIRDIKKWQSRPYNLQTVATILVFVEDSLNKYVEGVDYGDQWWRLSLEREPRERADDGGEKLNRLLQQSGL